MLRPRRRNVQAGQAVRARASRAVSDFGGVRRRRRGGSGLEVRGSVGRSEETEAGMFHIIWYLIIGFIVGLIARALLPGADHMGLLMTTIVGGGGSVVGGVICPLFSEPR